MCQSPQRKKWISEGLIFILFRVMGRVPNGQRQVHPLMSCQFITGLYICICGLVPGSRVPAQCSDGVLAPSWLPEHLYVLPVLGFELRTQEKSHLFHSNLKIWLGDLHQEGAWVHVSIREEKVSRYLLLDLCCLISGVQNIWILLFDLKVLSMLHANNANNKGLMESVLFL